MSSSCLGVGFGIVCTVCVGLTPSWRHLPCTLYPTPYTLNPYHIPYTRFPIPYTLCDRSRIQREFIDYTTSMITCGGCCSTRISASFTNYTQRAAVRVMSQVERSNPS